MSTPGDKVDVATGATACELSSALTHAWWAMSPWPPPDLAHDWSHDGHRTWHLRDHSSTRGRLPVAAILAHHITQDLERLFGSVDGSIEVEQSFNRRYPAAGAGA